MEVLAVFALAPVIGAIGVGISRLVSRVVGL